MYGRSFNACSPCTSSDCSPAKAVPCAITAENRIEAQPRAASAKRGARRFARPVPTTLSGLPSTRVQLHQPVKELVAFVERAHADALVQPVHAAAVGVAEHAVHPLGRDACVDRKTAVGRTREQGWYHRNARPHLRADG